MANLEHLITGYRLYKSGSFNEHKAIYAHYRQLTHKPHTLVLTSCSLPVSAESLICANPGDLYIVRNLGGIIPPFDSAGCAGTVAAVAYAVEVLQVNNIVALNHRHCDGVSMMMNNEHIAGMETQHNMMAPWLNVMRHVRVAVDKAMEGRNIDERNDVCVHEVIIASMRNLLDYPVVQRRRKEKSELNIYGMHFDLEEGELEVFNPKTGNFQIVT